jgi:hypothetical protein
MSQKDIRFDAVLPSHLIFNENIEPNAKLFYAVVRNLCNQCGYCWASNAYLEDLMKVSKSVIKNWLRSLVKEGYLFIDQGLPSRNNDRKIFVSDEFKKFIPGQKFDPPRSEICPHKEDSIKEDKNCSVPKAHSGTSAAPKKAPSFKKEEIPREVEKVDFVKHNLNGDIVPCSKSAMYKYAVSHMKDWTVIEMEEAWNVLEKYDKCVSDYIRFIEGTIEKTRTKINSKPKGKSWNNQKETQTKELKKDSDKKSWICADQDFVKQAWRT